MRLYLVQHGESFPETADPARPLTPRGRDDAGRMAALLARLGTPVRAIRHSGKRRARETAEILAGALHAREGTVEVSGLAPNDPVAPVAAELAAAAEDLVLVGHHPHLLCGQAG